MKKVLVLLHINMDKIIIITPVHQNYKSKSLFADASRRNLKKAKVTAAIYSTSPKVLPHSVSLQSSNTLLTSVVPALIMLT